MLRSLFAFAALTPAILLSAAPNTPAPTPVDAPASASALAPDPALISGQFANGFRYRLLPHRPPGGGISLRLLVSTGSLAERADQRGLAHYLEHMAFNGGRQFPAGSVVAALQRLGLAFGAHTNAYTSQRETVYQLDLPDASPATLEAALGAFADTAGHLQILPEKVEKERGIILSEKAARDTPGARTGTAIVRFLYAGTLLPDRLPIGTEEIIRAADAARLREFYDAWYRPERMTLVVVGDIDPAALRPQLEAAFASLAPRAPAPAPFTVPDAIASDGLRVFAAEDATAAVTQLALIRHVAFDEAPDSFTTRRRALVRQLGAGLLTRRLQRLAREPDSVFLDAGFNTSSLFEQQRQITLRAAVRPGHWGAALVRLESVVRETLATGFAADEFGEVVATVRTDLAQTARRAADRPTPAVANALVASLINGKVFDSPVTFAAWADSVLATVTADECRDALRADWPATGRLVVLSGRIDPAEATAEKVAALYATVGATAAASALAPPPARAWAYPAFGAAGAVTHRAEIADLGLTTVEFANGVRLTLKPTPFSREAVQFSVRLGRGQLREPADRPGLAQFSGALVNASGLGRHPIDELQRLLEGRQARVVLSVASDCTLLTGAGRRSDLPLALQWAAALITDPAFRPEGLALVRRGLTTRYDGLDRSLEAPLSREVAPRLASHDPRFVLPAREQVLAYTADDARAFLAPDLHDGAVEIGLVGDFDREDAIHLVAATLGTLSPRPAPSAPDPARLQVRFPAEPFTLRFEVPGPDAAALVQTYWPTDDGIDPVRRRQLFVLGHVLMEQLRVQVREELGDTYSPTAGSFASELYPGYGYLQATARTAPATAPRVLAATLAAADRLARDGVAPDQFERVHRPVLAGIRRQLEGNDYWLNLASRAQSRPETLAAARNLVATFETMTAADLSALARRYLVASRASSATLLPVSPSAPAASSP